MPIGDSPQSWDPHAKRLRPPCIIELVAVDDGVATVRIIGELDCAAAPALLDVLDAVPFCCAHLDVRSTSLVDAGALGVMLKIEEAAGGPGHLHLDGARPWLHKVLRICELERFIEPHDHAHQR